MQSWGKGEELSLRTRSAPPWPSEQNLLGAGAVGIQGRTWLCQAVGLVLLQVIYALLNEITVNEGAATAYLGTFW